MITKTSPLFDCRSHESPHNNDKRAALMVRLCGSRIPIKEIALVLNCSESLVRALLASQYQAVCPGCESIPVPLGIISLRGFESAPSGPKKAQAAALTLDVTAQYLAREIYGWLDSFEASNAEREQAIEQAVRSLDEARFERDGSYSFEVEWVAYEIRSIWSKPMLKEGERNFSTVIGRWLAAWVKFWVIDPNVWYRALALAYACFEGRKEAA